MTADPTASDADDLSEDEDGTVPGWQLTRLPQAAVRAAREARLPATLLGPFLDALPEVAAGGRRLPAEQLVEYRRLGRVAAEQGAALPALVDLYLSALWRAWPDLPAVRGGGGGGGTASGDDSGSGDAAVTADELRRAGLAVLRAADDAVAALCAGYDSAARAAARAEAEQRRELVDDLLSGESDVGGLLLRAADFGLRLEAPHVVLVASADRPFSEGRPTERRVEAALRRLWRRPSDARTDFSRTAGLGLLVTTHLGLLVAVLPVPTPGAEATGPATSRGSAGPAVVGTAGLTDPLTEAFRREPDLRWRAGVSRARTGVAGVRAGFAEASRTVELAAALDWPDPVVDARTLLVYQVLARDAEAMRELIDVTLAPLRTARGGAEPLLETLRAYFASGGVATAAARRLHLSVRALTYRLDRIAALTGYNPTDPEDRFTLQAATVGQQLLGWPELGWPDTGR